MRGDNLVRDRGTHAGGDDLYERERDAHGTELLSGLCGGLNHETLARSHFVLSVQF